MKMSDYYIYKCFCKDAVFENCPRLLAPKLDNKNLSEIKYRQADKILNNIKQINEIFNSYNVIQAKIFGPIVEGAASPRNEIDLWVEMKDYSQIRKIEEELSNTASHEFDLISYEEWISFKHNYIDKGDQIGIYPEI
jgi:predicted nucleotidyltransferase